MKTLLIELTDVEFKKLTKIKRRYGLTWKGVLLRVLDADSWLEQS